MSQCNIDNLQTHFGRVRDHARCILEIGVDCNLSPTEMTSTRTFLDNKLPDTVYVGVDIMDKSYLTNAAKNVFTIQHTSSDVEKIWSFVSSLGVDSIDFLFIDGWHSINQCLLEWEYTRWLAPNGIVAWHDTASHPGPYLFTRNLDQRKWHVIDNSCVIHDIDYGIGFAWRR
jgi:predicted O-methyltransferase YrrM